MIASRSSMVTSRLLGPMSWPRKSMGGVFSVFVAGFVAVTVGWGRHVRL